MINADGTGRRTLIKSTEISIQYPGALAWSPDGTQLAFATTPSGTGTSSGTIAVVGVSGGPAHPLVTGIPGGVTWLSWAPGPKPLFTSGHEPGIWEADGHGSAKLVLQCGACQLSYPSWAPDGAHFAAVRKGNGVIVATIVGGVQATIGPTDVTYVQWGGRAGNTSAPATASAGSSGASSPSQATLLAQVQVYASRRPGSRTAAVLLLRLPARGLLRRQRARVPDADFHPPGQVVVAGEVF